MTALTRTVLRTYPPSFRERYGDELDALVEDTGSSARTVLDLLAGSARAWLRPAFGADPAARRRRRVQASLTMTWTAWCAGFLVTPAVNRLLLDPPEPSVTGADRALLDGAQVLLAVGWIAALVGALPIAFRVLLRAPRSRRWPAVRPLLPAVALGVVEGILLGALVLVAHSHPADRTHPSVLFVVLGLLVLVGLVAFAAALGLGPALTVTRAAPDVRAMRVPALLSVPVALCLAGLTLTSLVAALDAGTGALGAGVLTVGCVASLVAMVSAARGAWAAVA